MITRNILLLSMTAAMCATPAVSSFYLGAGAGGSLMRGTVNISDQSSSQDSTTNIKSTGADFGAHFGYLYQLSSNHMFILGEGYYIKESGKSKTTNLTFTNYTTAATFSVKPTSNYGVSLGIGAFFNPKFNIYGKVGFEKKSLTTTYMMPNQTQASTGIKKAAWAFSPGVGIMYKITDSIAINPEYTYVMGRPYAVMQTKNSAQSITFTPTEHRVMLKLNYMFG